MPCFLCYHIHCHIKKQQASPWKSLACYCSHTGNPVSIHKTMITIFVKDCNQISQSFYDSVVFDLPFHQLTCSCSHSACLSVHGYYWRSVKLPSGTLRLRVCRVKCSECGTTHALLLSSMVPFSQIPLSEQQRICNDYEEGRCVSMVCETNPSIDENNVKSILRNYRLCWREKLRSLRICLFPLDTLILSCFSDYSSQFMQIHRRVNRLFPYTTQPYLTVPLLFLTIKKNSKEA